MPSRCRLSVGTVGAGSRSRPDLDRGGPVVPEGISSDPRFVGPGVRLFAPSLWPLLLDHPIALLKPVAICWTSTRFGAREQRPTPIDAPHRASDAAGQGAFRHSAPAS